MKATYNGTEIDFEIRPGMTLDMNPIGDIWKGDDYRIKSLQKEHPELKTILEIGGHIGIFTAMAAVLWPEASIRVYEAWEENYRLLVKHTRDFPNVTAFNKAVIGWDDKVVPFRLPHQSQHNTGDGRIDNKNMDNSHFNEGTIEVEACNILEAIGEWKVIDLLKLDCEGSEIPILERLHANGLLSFAGWIRGEWHGGEKNKERIKELLSGTHKIETEKTNHSYGLFWAERK